MPVSPKSSILLRVLVVFGAAVVIGFVVSTVVSVVVALVANILIPAFILSAVGVAGWWGIRSWQGVPRRQLQAEIGQLGRGISVGSRRVTYKTAKAAYAAMRAYSSSEPPR